MTHLFKIDSLSIKIAVTAFIVFLSIFSVSSAFAQADANLPLIEQESNTEIDSEIDRRITEIFRQIEGLKTLFVTVDAGVVTLRGTVANAEKISQAEELASRVKGVVAIVNNISQETSIEERLVPVYERIVSQANKSLRFAPLIIIALFTWALVIVFGWLITSGKWPWTKVTPNAFIADLLRRVVFLFFVIVGAVIALDIIGATALIGTILGAAGIVGLAVGFAIRDTVENFIASILLSIRQPFSPKDYVEIEGRVGNVLRLTSRATILIEPSGNHVRIPNSMVFKGVIVNYTRNPDRRFEFRVGVAAESNLAKAIAAGITALKDLEFVHNDPPPDGWIEELGDSNIVLVFVGWIDQMKNDFNKARSEAMRVTKQILEDNDFDMPEPIYRLKIDSSYAATNQIKAKTKQKKTSKVDEKIIQTNDSTALDVKIETAVLNQIDSELDNKSAEDLLSDPRHETLE